MDRVITYSFSDNFIDKCAEFICDNFLGAGCDLSRVACVFGGKRPALFLRRALSGRIKKAFYPPRIFSIDEFVEYVLAPGVNLRKIADLDACHLIYTLTKKHAPSVLKGRSSFTEFLPWAREISSFIEQLDLEDIQEESLRDIAMSAAIGYDVPQSINVLLQHIMKIRSAYRVSLAKSKLYSRGLVYLSASKEISKKQFDEFDAVCFCNFFYLHATEERIIKAICEGGKGICIFQGSTNEWSVLRRNAENLNLPIAKEQKSTGEFNLSLYHGFDSHSQACVVREILKGKIKEKEKTVIVLPRPQALTMLLSEISSLLGEFNVSMGYPLRRSSLYVLFDSLAKAQISKKDGKYYTKDYLNAIRHPLAKNLKLSDNPAVTRVLVHKIEELLQGIEKSSIGGSLFLSLAEIEREERIYLLACETLSNMNVEIELRQCKTVLRKLHCLLFENWSKLSDFHGFARNLTDLLNTLVEKSMLSGFSFNIKVIEKLYTIKEELESVSFSKESLEPIEIWEIFQQKLDGAMISFAGSPLKGTQILGLFETRSLNFDNVIVMDMNESVLPKLKIYEPLIPREVMLSLGLNRLEKEEEIQRYQFMRLIRSAKNIHLVYEENQIKEKSRFIEELLWARQKKAKKLEVVTISKASFAIKIPHPEPGVRKTTQMIEFLKKQTYSASRINTYLNCPLQFYYQYVLGLKENQDLLQDPEASCVGRFIHELLYDVFTMFKGKKPVIDAGFRRYFIKNMESKFNKEIARRMRSDSLLLKKIIHDRMMRFLDNEIKRNISRILCLEEQRFGAIKLCSQKVEFVYTVDRIDEFDDKSVMVIDYKTGGASIVPRRLKSLEVMEANRRSIKENIRSFQLPLYYYFAAKEFPDSRVNAQLYGLRTLELTPFISESDFPQKEQIMRVIFTALEYIFSEIIDINAPFEADKEERQCRYCAFRGMCAFVG